MSTSGTPHASMRTRGDAQGCNLSPARFYALSNDLTEQTSTVKGKEKKNKERERAFKLTFYVAYICVTL